MGRSTQEGWPHRAPHCRKKALIFLNTNVKRCEEDVTVDLICGYLYVCLSSFQNRNVKRCFTFYNLWLFVCLSCLCLCLPGRRLDNGHTCRSGALLCRAVLVRCDRAPERIIAIVCLKKNKTFLNRIMILKMPRVQGGAFER